MGQTLNTKSQTPNRLRKKSFIALLVDVSKTIGRLTNSDDPDQMQRVKRPTWVCGVSSGIVKNS